jgi:hypothetical protein
VKQERKHYSPVSLSISSSSSDGEGGGADPDSSGNEFERGKQNRIREVQEVLDQMIEQSNGHFN